MQRPDEALRALTGYRLRRTTSVAMSRMNAVFVQFGLRRTTYSTLALIIAKPGQRQGQIAKALAIERPNFVQIVDELEAAGLITRTTAPDDKRAYALHATERGQQLYEEACLHVQKTDHRLVKGLTESQVEQLHHALDLIAKNSCNGET